MAEYIDREALKNDIAKSTEPFNTGSVFRAINCQIAADVAPVVHCKDCAHRTEMGNCGHPRYHGILPPAHPYDFCSYGARMAGGIE